MRKKLLAVVSAAVVCIALAVSSALPTKPNAATLINPFLFAEKDPNFSYVVSLPHMDGTDASTTFSDAFRTWTAQGNAQIDTAQSKFGGASGLFDGNGDYIDTPSSANFDFGSGDFTIQCWWRSAATISAGQYQFIMGAKSSASIYFGVRESTGYKLVINDTTGSLEAISSAFTFAINTWYHLETGRVGDNMYQFVDGVLLGTTAVTGLSYNFNSGSGGTTLGARTTAASEPVNGWLDDCVIHKGVGLHTSGFTPRTSAWPDS